MTEEPISARKRFSRTLSGDEPGAEIELDENGQSVAERHKPQGNTLLGHPPTPAAGPTLPGQPGPVLAPPKWRGAGAYREGEEPRPHVSLIPVPPAMAGDAAPPNKPIGVPIGVMRSTVKTKVGQPPPPARVQPVAKPAVPAAEPPPAVDDTLKDTIQQMLEQQASVPIQVEEGIPELPIDELVDDESTASDTLLADEDTQRPPPDLAEREASDEPVPRAAAQPELKLVPDAAEPVAADPVSSESELTAREPEPAVDAPEVPSLEPAPAPEAKRRERRPAASLAGVEASRGFLPHWKSEAGRGLIFMAAMVLIGWGGWALTRGGYRPKPVAHPPPAEAAAPAEPAATAEAKKPTESAPPSAVPEAPATAPSTATSAVAVTKDSSAQRAVKKPRTPSEEEPEATEPPAEPRATAEPTGVLTVRPRAEEPSADLPESPTRDNVIATLNGLRPAFVECAQGQRGVAQLDITVIDSGAVSHVVVGGDFAGSTQGSCIARAARNAQFAPFKKPRFRLVYPISL